jgi:predicted esterase
MDREILSQLGNPDPNIRRNAVMKIAASDDPRVLTILERIYKNDPDPEIRELALQTGREVHKKSRERQTSPPQPVSTTPIPLSAPEQDDPQKQPSQQQKATAQWNVDRALSFHLKGKNAEAIKALGKALQIQSDLARNPMVVNLAKEITGLTAHESIQSLQQKEQTQEITKITSGKEPKEKTHSSMLPRVFLGLAILVLTVLVIWFVRSGLLDRYSTFFQNSFLARNKYTINGTEYYLLSPDGEPPADGWPAIVVLHGYGGNGKDLLPIAEIFTSQGVLFISPTFGGYEPYPGIGPIQPMNDILSEVRSRYPVNSQGVVLYGFSQGGTFAYRYSIFEPNQVAGVVTAGAPDLEGGFPASITMPYIFTWGELDGLQEFVLPIANQIKSQGYNVETAIVANAGHEVTQYSLDRTLQMINSLFSR